MAPPRHPLRPYIIALFRRGDLVSVYEAMQISGASRQAICKWLKAENIDIAAHRMAKVATYATNAQRYLDGLPPLRPPTKAQMRKRGVKAKTEWDARHAAEQESISAAADLAAGRRSA